MYKLIDKAQKTFSLDCRFFIMQVDLPNLSL